MARFCYHAPMFDSRRLTQMIESSPALRFRTAFLADHPTGTLFLVGGAVRDALLGRTTVDIDLVASGIPREKLEAWFKLHGQADLTGRVFGVYKFIPQGSSVSVDIALPRTERPTEGSLGGYRDFDAQSDPNLSIERDLARRDFTVNATAYDLRMNVLEDPFGGLRDLEARIIRAVGEPALRFGEDLSRLLRGIRFACQLGFEIDTETWTALCALMPEANRTRQRPDGGSEFVLPRETVGRELAKALLADPARAARLLADSGALKVFLLDAERAISLPETLEALAVRPSLPATLAILLREARPEVAKLALERSGLASLPSGSALRAQAEDVAWIIRELHTKNTVMNLAPSTFERAYLGARGELLMETLDALKQTDFVTAIRARREAIEKSCDRPLPVPALIDGHDVLVLGVPPGPRIRTLLDFVRDAQLNGEVRTKSKALELLKTKITP